MPSLDGLRAISILLVLLSHCLGTHGFPQLPSRWFALGDFGVRIFFVISGFLITSILIRELDGTQTISLSRFYIRRAMRLLPALYVYIGVVVLLAYAGIVRVTDRDIAFGLTYSMNFDTVPGWNFGHFWSLAIEEQFYLLWPFGLLLLRTRRAAAKFLAGVLIVDPFIRIASHYVGPAFNFFVWTDALGSGCLLALLRTELADNRHYRRVLESRWFFLVPTIALLCNYIPSTKLSWLFGVTIMNVSIAMTIDWAMRNTTGIAGRFLNQPAISFLGVASYSIYVWQQVFIDRHADNWFNVFPVNVALALAAAMMSYLLIECPCLRLRSALFRRVSLSRTAQLAAAQSSSRGTDRPSAAAGQ